MNWEVSEEWDIKRLPQGFDYADEKLKVKQADWFVVNATHFFRVKVVRPEQIRLFGIWRKKDERRLEGM